jgi:hypothetical protein
MPHFENIDQYEAKNPKSGEKEIIPIAPHSMQAVDYRLSKERKSEAPQRKRNLPLSLSSLTPFPFVRWKRNSSRPPVPIPAARSARVWEAASEN